MGRDAEGQPQGRLTFSRLLLVAGAVLIVGSGFRLSDPDPGTGSDMERVEVDSLGTAIGRAGAPRPGGAPSQTSAPALPPAVISDPAQVRIPAIGVDAAITRLGLNADGSLAVPKKWQEVGWFERGPAPGAVGPAVLVGHYDSTTGPAVFYRLRALRPGDQVEVASPTGLRTTFTVDRTEDVTKKTFPTDRVYGPVSRPELRLITCGGAFDDSTNHYLSNLIVYAHANAPVVAAGPPAVPPTGPGGAPAAQPAPANPQTASAIPQTAPANPPTAAPGTPVPGLPAPGAPAPGAPARGMPGAPAAPGPAIPAAPRPTGGMPPARPGTSLGAPTAVLPA